jgi:predicted ArsR family transcriptional regulator
MMIQTTPSSILAYLRDNGPASIAQLSIALSLTKADIRFHIKKLILTGGIVEHNAEPAGLAGRPACLYELSPSHLPNNYLNLLLCLLKIEKLPMNQGKFQDFINGLVKQMPLTTQTGSPIQRYNAAMIILQSQNYSPRWEAGSHGPRFIFQACPYQILVTDFPWLCQFDTVYLSTLTGTPLHIRDCKAQANSRQCVFESSEVSKPASDDSIAILP